MSRQHIHQTRRNIPITLTMPESVVKDLHLDISKRKISNFVAELVEKRLESEKEKLSSEFREAATDKERTAEIELWDTLSDEGLNDTNSYFALGMQ